MSVGASSTSEPICTHSSTLRDTTIIVRSVREGVQPQMGHRCTQMKRQIQSVYLCSFVPHLWLKLFCISLLDRRRGADVLGIPPCVEGVADAEEVEHFA